MADDDIHKRMQLRFLAFMRKDEAIFSEALRESFPHVMFLPDPRSGWSVPSAQSYYDSLADVPTSWAAIAFPDDGLWRPPAMPEKRVHDWAVHNRILRHRVFFYERVTWHWGVRGSWPEVHQMAYDPPTMRRGLVYGNYYIDDPDHGHFLAIAKRMFRIITRIATNRTKGGHPLGNLLMGGDTVMMADASRGQEWCGHSILEWCREAQRTGKGHMLFGTRRPCDDWEVPKNEWYQSLIRKVTERYGTDFNDPPPPQLEQSNLYFPVDMRFDPIKIPEEN